jgi:DNA-binding transcriptional MerR regulator
MSDSRAYAHAFNAKVAAKLTSLSYRQVIHWDATGLIKPSVKAAAGRGSRRIYSFEDLVELRVVAMLRKAGVSLQAVRRAVRYLHQHSGMLRPLAKLRFITDGTRIFVLSENPKALLDATANGQLTFTVAVGQIVEQLQREVTAILAPRTIPVRTRGRTFNAELTPDLEAGGFTIAIPELPGCFSEADSLGEARAMAREAIGGWLDANEDVRDVVN